LADLPPYRPRRIPGRKANVPASGTAPWKVTGRLRIG
jgi:hypothetical protein